MSVILPCLEIMFSDPTYLTFIFLLAFVFGLINKLCRG